MRWHTLDSVLRPILISCLFPVPDRPYIFDKLDWRKKIILFTKISSTDPNFRYTYNWLHFWRLFILYFHPPRLIMAALSNMHPPYLYIRNISTSFSLNNEVCRKRWLTLRPRIFRTRKFATGPRIISDHCLAGIIRGTQLFPYAHSEGPC